MARTAAPASRRATPTFDYIVVGSGAGGGPLAANLARAGMRVLLLEAGTDAENYTYQVPCFHGLASEDADYSWDFFVRHYGDDGQQAKDPKFDPQGGGIFYPRAGTLGGCTAHNAMITVCPHDRDWDSIAELTGDRSWQAAAMRRYFERLERCTYRHRPRPYPRNRFLAAVVRRVPVLSRWFGNHGRHGYDGWLSTDQADPKLVFPDNQIVDILLSAAREALSHDIGRALEPIQDLLLGQPGAYTDPNDWSFHATSGEGLWLIPVAVRDGRRNGTREYIRETKERYPHNLEVRLGALATRVLFDGTRAVGVEYIAAPHAYGADPQHDASADGPVETVHCAREVILAGGAFNTPQLLKLSGIGPREELAQFAIDVLVDLPGVGAGLQDRYEVGVVSEMKKDFELLAGGKFGPPADGDLPDPYFEDWLDTKGVYCTNGALLGVIKKSRPDLPQPDLFIFGLPARFAGYSVGYSKQLEQHKRFFTWAVLKAHTNNTAGSVTLRSNDPRDVPEINFRYFEEGNDAAGEDLEAVVAGVRFARQLMEHASGNIVSEVLPGATVDTDDELKEFIRNQAWGHHASCTCRIGPAGDQMAVVDSAFRVHGTQGLRVVDASVFPRIPGFFIVTAVYMLSEKASDVILADVRVTTKAARRLGRRARGVTARLTPQTQHTRRGA